MIYGVMKMKEIHRSDTDFRHHYTPTKENALSLSAKTLYAGRLLRSRHWKEELHSHEFCEIVFVRSGAGFARIGDGSFEIKGGDILIYNAGVPHLERTEGKTPLELLFFACSGLQLNDLPKDWLLPKDVTPLIHSSGERMKRFETCFLSRFRDRNQPAIRRDHDGILDETRPYGHSETDQYRPKEISSKTRLSPGFTLI